MYGRSQRTTSALEAYNNQLNKKITANADFYAFAKALIKQESEKFTNLELDIASAGGVQMGEKRGVSVLDCTERRFKLKLFMCIIFLIYFIYLLIYLFRVAKPLLLRRPEIWPRK